MMAADSRECFSAAAAAFVAVVSTISGADWEGPGLGVWTVRDLVGHTSRSLTTIETYLAHPPGAVVLHQPVDYLLALRGAAVDPEAIAQRGRDAGAALGNDPAAAVRALAERVVTLVASTPDETPLQTALGGSTLKAYLPTRTFELTVHTLDLTVALSTDPPPMLATPIEACLALAAAAAAGRGAAAAEVLLALTGRRALPAGFSIV